MVVVVVAVVVVVLVVVVVVLVVVVIVELVVIPAQNRSKLIHVLETTSLQADEIKRVLIGSTVIRTNQIITSCLHDR